MTFKESIITCIHDKYFSFRGRASCSEFWYFNLFTLLIYLPIVIFFGTWANKPLIGLYYGIQNDMFVLRAVGTIICVFLFLPSVAVTMRRFHDRGLSYWWYFGAGLAAAVIGVPEIVILIGSLFVTVPAGEHFVNKFGADPTKPEGPNNLYEEIAAGPSVEMTQLMNVMGLARTKHGMAIVGCLVLVAIASFYALWSFNKPLRYDSITYDDGTVEYRLVNGGRDRTRGNGDDQHWVLRFPEGLRVESFEEYIQRTRKRDLLPRKGRSGYNRSIELFVRLPDFANVTGEYPSLEDNTLRVDLESWNKEYGSGSYQKWGSSFSSKHDKTTNFECRKDKEILSGLYQLREPTEAEHQLIREEYGSEARRFTDGCRLDDPKDNKYSVYDASGRPNGMGDCRQRSGSSEWGKCRFRFWLPQNRMATYSFSEQYLTQIHEIHTFVTDLLNEATDEEKSVNMQVGQQR